MVQAGEEEQKFDSSLALVFANRFCTVIVAGVILLYNKESMVPSAPISHYAAVSVANIIATACQFEALKCVALSKLYALFTECSLNVH
jgi:adenosine 3'-phospho 5'-phosphosulfate transporter B2